MEMMDHLMAEKNKQKIIKTVKWDKSHQKKFKKDNLSYLDKLNMVKFCYGGLVLGLSQFSILPLKMMLDSKVVKRDSKITISLH